jgi:hypothetical protein
LLAEWVFGSVLDLDMPAKCLTERGLNVLGKGFPAEGAILGAFAIDKMRRECRFGHAGSEGLAGGGGVGRTGSTDLKYRPIEVK